MARIDIFRIPIPFLHILPIEWVRTNHDSKSTARKPYGYWDHPVKQITPGEAELHFVQCFDWNRLDYLDFRYYKVQIARFDAHPDLVGREALIDRQHSVVHLAGE